MSTFISGVTTARRIAALVLAAGSASQSCADAHDADALSPESETALYADAEARGLGVAYDSQGYLRVQDGLNWWYVGRVASEAMPAASAARPGLHRRPRMHPAGLYDYALVYDDALGRRMELAILPASADWQGLQAALHELPGVTQVAHDGSGDLMVVIDGQRVYGRLTPLVATTIAMWVNFETHLQWAGDQNGDGAGDYYVIYPQQSLVQRLYVYPPHP